MRINSPRSATSTCSVFLCCSVYMHTTPKRIAHKRHSEWADSKNPTIRPLNSLYILAYMHTFVMWCVVFSLECASSSASVATILHILQTLILHDYWTLYICFPYAFGPGGGLCLHMAGFWQVNFHFERESSWVEREVCITFNMWWLYANRLVDTHTHTHKGQGFAQFGIFCFPTQSTCLFA